MKKIIIAITLIALCLTFAACGTEKAENTGTGNPPAVTEASKTDVPADTESDAKQEDSAASRYIELSGKAEDTFITEQDCYTEGDDVILFFQKGVTVRGDMLLTTERIMNEIRISTGLDFDKKYDSPINIDYIDEYFEKGYFEDILSGTEKIYIIVRITATNGAVQYAFNDGAVLESPDFDVVETFNQSMYHELTHVAHLRSGVDLSSTLNEGYASYIEDRTQRRIGQPSWNAIQFYSGLLFDDSVIYEGEAGFKAFYDDEKDKNYQYGFRFMSFLTATYGDDIFNKILAEATAQNYDASYDYYALEESINEDTQQLIAIIKSQTDDDVFEKFTEWYKENWEKEVSDYYAHLTALGLW